MLPLADELLIQLSAPNRRAAAELCAAHIESGMPLRDLVDDVLAPAMSQVGCLWQAAVWSVVDEHIATGVAETALSAAAASTSRGPTGGDVVVACVEGDWHSLPARMLAEVLDGEGCSVRFLGASHPTSGLTDYVRLHRPDAVFLSCAVPMALPALLVAIDALHQLSTTVFVGGRALGATPRRAISLGADGWAPNATRAAKLLESKPLRLAPPTPALARLSEYRDLHQHLPAWVGRAMIRLALLMPAVASFPTDVRERTELDLHHVLDTAAIATLLEDETIVVEQIHWLLAVLAARAVPAEALAHGLNALLDTKPRSDVRTTIGPMLAAAHDATGERTDGESSRFR